MTRPMDVHTEWQTVFVLKIEIMFIYLLESKTNGGENCQEFHLNTCIQLHLKTSSQKFMNFRYLFSCGSSNL